MIQKPTIHFVEPVAKNRAELARIGYSLGFHVELYDDVAELADRSPSSGIVVARDCTVEGGINDVIYQLKRGSIYLPLVAVDFEPQTKAVVDAIRAGALDYFKLPLDIKAFEHSLQRIVQEATVGSKKTQRFVDAQQRINALSNREREVLDLLSQGNSNKIIAKNLGISCRTVEVHRSKMMRKLGAHHSAEVVRLKLDATRAFNAEF